MIFWELFFIAVFYVQGMGYDVLKEIGRIRKKYPALEKADVLKTFWDEDWNTIFISALGFITTLSSWYLIRHFHFKVPEWLFWGVYPLSFVLGFSLQRLVYSFLGTSESIIEKNIDKYAPKP